MAVHWTASGHLRAFVASTILNKSLRAVWRALVAVHWTASGHLRAFVASTNPKQKPSGCVESPCGCSLDSLRHLKPLWPAQILNKSLRAVWRALVAVHWTVSGHLRAFVASTNPKQKPSGCVESPCGCSLDSLQAPESFVASTNPKQKPSGLCGEPLWLFIGQPPGT